MHVLPAIHQYVAVNIWSEGGFCQSQVKPFVFEALFESFLPLPWIHPTADLIKSLNTCAGQENFIPTKFHKHPSSGSVVKADYVCSHIYWSNVLTERFSIPYKNQTKEDTSF